MERNFTSVKKGEYNGELACYIIVENGITSHLLDSKHRLSSNSRLGSTGNNIAEAD